MLLTDVMPIDAGLGHAHCLVDAQQAWQWHRRLRAMSSACHHDALLVTRDNERTVWLDAHFRVAFGHDVAVAPVAGCIKAVKQSCLSEQQAAGTSSSHDGTWIRTIAGSTGSRFHNVPAGCLLGQ